MRALVIGVAAGYLMFTEMTLTREIPYVKILVHDHHVMWFLT